MNNTTPARAAAAAAGIGTALLLQATLVAPVFGTVPVSLPAVVVAAVALVDGPAVGIAFGFAAGLVADLGSDHPAGILALCWLAVGLVAGTFAERRNLRRDAAAVAVICTAAAVAATALLALVHGATIGSAIRGALPCLLGDLLLAFGIVPLVRRMLRSDRLRPPRPVGLPVAAGGHRG
ncbi:MAG TPA: hypothetical protein VFH38_04830 [Jatrophihabitans sp.]|nr:hypothetical protein [Jatrophihabitans sp.]